LFPNIALLPVSSQILDIFLNFNCFVVSKRGAKIRIL
jgi:hypothetical protein